MLLMQMLEEIPIPVITLTQSVIIGLIAVVVGNLANILIAKTRNEFLGKNLATAVVFIVSMVLAYIWFGQNIAFKSTDPMDFAVRLLNAAGPIVGFATLIYNLMLSQLFTKAGWVQKIELPAPPVISLESQEQPATTVTYKQLNPEEKKDPEPDPEGDQKGTKLNL